jgi:hypothetical protein
MTVTPRGRYESAVDSCDFGHLHRTVACAESTAQCCRIGTNAVFGIIAGDKTKTWTYCQVLDLSDELDQVDQQKDRKKAGDLSQKINELQTKLGPEYLALLESTKYVDPNSKGGQEIVSIFDKLDSSCRD